jgi:hypothetical protein
VTDEKSMRVTKLFCTNGKYKFGADSISATKASDGHGRPSAADVMDGEKRPPALRLGASQVFFIDIYISLIYYKYIKLICEIARVKLIREA